MGILRTYVISETLKVFAMAMLASGLLMTLAGCGREAIRQGLPPYVLIQIAPFISLEILRFTLPGCTLFAVCSVFGHLAAANEFSALKAAGINPMRIISPVLAAAVVMSLGTFLTYELSAVWARPGLKRAVHGAATDILYGVLRSSRSYSDSRLSIIVKGVEGERLLDPVICFQQPDGRSIRLSAEEATLKLNRASGVVRFCCSNGNVSLDSDSRFAFGNRWTHDVKLLPSDQINEDWVSPSWLPFGRIKRQIEREQVIVARLDQENEPEVRPHLKSHRGRLFRLRAEGQRRLANGFGCFCFAMVGIPVALWMKSAENVTVFFTCFAPILIVYYPLLVVGETLARRGVAPSVSVWLANAVLALVGGLLLIREVRR